MVIIYVLTTSRECFTTQPYKQHNTTSFSSPTPFQLVLDSLVVL